MEPASPISPAILEGMFAALQNSNVPMRRPSWNDPTFWSRPLIRTTIVPLSASTSWSSILTVAGRDGYSALVNGFTFTTFAAAALAQVRFRLLFNKRFLSTVDLPQGVETNRESATLFPTFPRKIFRILDTAQDSIVLQAINDGTYQQLLICGFFGWYFDNRNQAERGTLEGLTDA